MSKQSSKRGLIISLSVVGAILLAIVVFCVVYVSDYYRAEQGAIPATSPDGIEIIYCDDMITFMPDKASAGIIFYPGGKVEYTAYAPLMLACAERGIACVLVEMPCNLAVLGINKADGIIEEYPQIEKWYMAGHSLGGSMASSYIEKNEADFDGLILLASYSTIDISDTSLDVISIYGSNDGVLNKEKYLECKENLPGDFVEYVIEGGNHAGFGMYGAQDGDGNAQITGQEQIRVTAQKISEIIK